VQRSTITRLMLSIGFGTATLPVSALPLSFDFPAPATQTFDRSEALTSYALPIGPFANEVIKTTLIEGALQQTVWQLQAKGLSTLQTLAPLRQQLTKAGYELLFECETFACGGFDFRFGTNIAAEPAMHVDLGDFRYLAAKRSAEGGADHVSLVVSRSSTLAFVQMTQIVEGQIANVPLVAPTDPIAREPLAKPSTSTLGEGFARRGSVALDDLIFASGAAGLAPGEYASLEALAAYLRSNPASKVALVGHTDASGALAGNIALSKQRAESVRNWMIESYAIPPDQISAEGVGYLAPRDSNLTETGLTRNRRVEVMLLVSP
jgi:outer membrane protein OmpA-like peptidoglycan-associated protein